MKNFDYKKKLLFCFEKEKKMSGKRKKKNKFKNCFTQTKIIEKKQ